MPALAREWRSMTQEQRADYAVSAEEAPAQHRKPQAGHPDVVPWPGCGNEWVDKTELNDVSNSKRLIVNFGARSLGTSKSVPT